MFEISDITAGCCKFQNNFGSTMARAAAPDIEWAKKVSGPSKSLNFVPGPFKILEMAPFSIVFKGCFHMACQIYNTRTSIVKIDFKFSFFYENVIRFLEISPQMI
jgi:hypothetical protein